MSTIISLTFDLWPFHAYPVHDQDLCAKWMKANPRKDCAVCRRVHCLHVLFILSSIDAHFTFVAKSCTHFVVVKQLRYSEDGWNGARFQIQTTSTSLVRNNQLPIFFRACCYPQVYSRSEKDKSGRCTFILLTSWVSVWSATSAKKSEALCFWSTM